MSRFLALLGVVFFALSFLTPVRSRWLSKQVGGLAQQFRLHHWLGIFAIVLIALHVLWELFHAQSWVNLKTLLWSSDLGLLSAWMAIGLIFVSLLGSYRRSFSFMVWRSIHLLFAVSFFFAAVHFVLFRNDHWMDQTVVFSSIALAAGGCCYLIFSYVWLPQSRVFRVLSHKSLQKDIWEMTLVADDKRPVDYRAGQVVYAKFLDAGFSHALHPFSVASCRFEPTVRLIIKSLGHDTLRLHTLTSDSKMRLLGPYHELKPSFDSPQIWIAGGIGIAPFIGFLHCLPMQASAPIVLLHYVTRAEDAVQLKEWPELSKYSHLFTLKIIVDKPSQMPNVQQMDALLEGFESPRVLICGSPNFMKYIRNHLLKKGVSANKIITEEFNP
jgi:predicted ferric reductase